MAYDDAEFVIVLAIIILIDYKYDEDYDSDPEETLRQHHSSYGPRIESIRRRTNVPTKQPLTYVKRPGLRLGFFLNVGETMMKSGIIRTVNNLPDGKEPWRTWRLCQRLTDHSNTSIQWSTVASLRVPVRATFGTAR